MIKKILYLEDNMIDENEREIFQADIPYEVRNGFIMNEDAYVMSLGRIWVNFRLVHKTVAE